MEEVDRRDLGQERVIRMFGTLPLRVEWRLTLCAYLGGCIHQLGEGCHVHQGTSNSTALFLAGLPRR